MEMTVEPLRQWVCDTCHELVERPEDGWLQWRSGSDSDEGQSKKAHSFQIVHHITASPCRDTGGCYGPDTLDRKDLPLDTMIGTENLSRLVGILSPGDPFHPSDTDEDGAVHVREFVEVFRRLTLPGYEQARQYFGEAREHDFFDGRHTGNAFTPANLTAIIDRFGTPS